MEAFSQFSKLHCFIGTNEIVIHSVKCTTPNLNLHSARRYFTSTGSAEPRTISSNSISYASFYNKYIIEIAIYLARNQWFRLDEREKERGRYAGRCSDIERLSLFVSDNIQCTFQALSHLWDAYPLPAGTYHFSADFFFGFAHSDYI